MIHDVLLPQLSMGMSEGTIVEWFVEEGAHVEKGANLVAIETEKVVNDLPAPRSGFLHVLAAPEATLPIENTIAQLADTEEEFRQLLAGTAAQSDSAEPAAESPVTASQGVAAATPRRIAISGLARKEAALRGIDIANLSGSGPRGRILMRDIEAATQQLEPQAANSSSTVAGVKARIPITGVRRKIAERLTRAHTEAAMVYSYHEIDVTRLISTRNRFLEQEQAIGTRISMMAFYAKALALAARSVPICNSTLESDEVIIWDDVNIAFAVAVPGRTDFDSSLMTPVIRNVESKSLSVIDREIKDLAERARAGTLKAEELTGGTINLSSSGGFHPDGWMVGAPLLNLPMTLSFGPGTTIDKALVVDGEIVARTVLPFGVTFDHRAYDGEPSGRFVRKLCEYLVNPEMLVL